MTKLRPIACRKAWTLAAGAVFALALAASTGGAANAAPAASPAPAVKTLTIGYLELSQDPRYAAKWSYAHILLRRGGRAVQGAELGLEEAKLLGRFEHIDFALTVEKAADAKALIAAIPKMEAQGIHIFLLDAPGPVAATVAKAEAKADVLLLNVSAESNALRNQACESNLYDVTPSRAMLTDAMAQFLVWKKWRRVLMLQGPLPADAAIAKSFLWSAKRFGLSVTTRKFILSEDPRLRDKSNLALLTQGTYDVVYVIDTDGEFGRHVPYDTLWPRPVVGTVGLVATAWNWAFERYGAPQLSQRFETLAHRRMRGADWSAWAAVKLVATAAVESQSTDFAPLKAYVESNKLRLDGYKGWPLDFRPWDHQLRQPVLLAARKWVVAVPPMPGFLNAVNNLDTLGYAQQDSTCRF